MSPMDEPEIMREIRAEKPNLSARRIVLLIRCLNVGSAKNKVTVRIVNSVRTYMGRPWRTNFIGLKPSIVPNGHDIIYFRVN